MSSRRLRIGFIGGRGVIGTYSGIETYYEEVGARLVDRGHHVTAYCRTYFTPPVPSHRGIEVRRLPSVRTKHLETASHSLLSTLDGLFRGFDIIQYHAIGSSLLALAPRLLGCRTIVSVRGLDWQRAKWGRVARAFLRFGEWASVRCPTATIVVSETLQRHYVATHGQKPFVIPNAVVPADRREPDRIREFGLEKDEFLLFAGRISPEKGLHTLLEALRPLSSAKKLVLAGGTSYSDDYIRRIREMAWDDVKFLGRVDRNVMKELLSNCYAFVLPSDMEGLSVALLEALSYGNCIIASDIPENLEVIGSAGLTFPPGDVEGLREALREVLGRPETVKKRRAEAEALARRQPDWDEVARRTEALYLAIVDGVAQPGRRQDSDVVLPR